MVNPLPKNVMNVGGNKEKAGRRITGLVGTHYATKMIRKLSRNAIESRKQCSLSKFSSMLMISK